MADEKPQDKKPGGKPKDKLKEKPAGWAFDPIEAIIVLLFLLTIVGSLVPSVLRYISSGEISFFGFKLVRIVSFFKDHSLFFNILGFGIAGGAAIGTFVLNKMGDLVWQVEKAKLYPTDMSVIGGETESTPSPLFEKWQNILNHSVSINPSDWRLAIIEADIILDELLDQLHLPGDTMGDKLKAVEKSDFITLDLAWEAHKVRNQIAHQGSGFLLNQYETRRVISLYGEVFKEFGLIK